MTLRSCSHPADRRRSFRRLRTRYRDMNSTHMVFRCYNALYKIGEFFRSLSDGLAPFASSYGFVLWKNATMRAALSDGKV